MPNPNLPELRERVKGLTGADPDADAVACDLCLLLQGRPDYPEIASLIVAAFRGSLDAALALVERMLPGWRVEDICQSLDGTWWDAVLQPKYGDGSISAETDRGMPTPALAVLAALMEEVDG